MTKLKLTTTKFVTGAIYHPTKKHRLIIKYLAFDRSVVFDDHEDPNYAYGDMIVKMDDPIRGLSYFYAIPRYLSNPMDIGMVVKRRYDQNQHILASDDMIGLPHVPAN